MVTQRNYHFLTYRQVHLGPTRSTEEVTWMAQICSQFIKIYHVKKPCSSCSFAQLHTKGQITKPEEDCDGHTWLRNWTDLEFSLFVCCTRQQGDSWCFWLLVPHPLSFNNLAGKVQLLFVFLQPWLDQSKWLQLPQTWNNLRNILPARDKNWNRKLSPHNAKN